MSIVGAFCLWSFAIFGVFSAVCVVWTSFDAKKNKPEVELPKPPVQITNLRTIPRPEPEADPDRPQILQKTTMQITTTKYVDPNAGTKELSA